MDRAEIEDALRDVGAELASRELRGDIVIVGGAWMALVLRAREATRDVDAYIAPDSAAAVREAVAAVARRRGLPDDWLNDAVKGFFASAPETVDWAEYDGLRVQAVTADYMLAMKALAARPQDVDDLRTLVRHLGITTLAEALATVERHVPARLLTARTSLTLESLFEEEAPS